jgi:hypothetical protein
MNGQKVSRFRQSYMFWAISVYRPGKQKSPSVVLVQPSGEVADESISNKTFLKSNSAKFL